MEMSLKEDLSSVEGISEEYLKYRQEHHKEVSSSTTNLGEDGASKLSEAIQQLSYQKLPVKDEFLSQADGLSQENSLLQEDTVKNNQQKVAVLYELLSACVADLPQDRKEQSRHRKGYDARLRVALRLLATWLNVKWTKMVCLCFNCHFRVRLGVLLKINVSIKLSFDRFTCTIFHIVQFIIILLLLTIVGRRSFFFCSVQML